MAKFVTIVAPYDGSVSSEIVDESVPVWEAMGWTVQQDVTPAPATTGSATQTSSLGSATSTVVTPPKPGTPA